MTTPFAHVEILGPRASLDAWLAVLQDGGTCHLVDALQGLEGESGVGRPLPSAAEREALTLRSGAAHRLRAVERILPGTADGEDASARPTFTVGLEGEGRVDLEAHCAAASEVAARLVAALEAGRAADHRRQEAEAFRLAVSAFQGRGWEDLDGLAFAWPLEVAGLQRLERRFRGLGADVGKAEGTRQVVLALRSPASARAALRDAAHAAGGRDVVWPEGVLQAPSAAPERAEAASSTAREADKDALTALRRVIDEDGASARAFLDAVDDAEAREALSRRLASSEFVTAARAYVREEDLPALARAIDHRFGKEVVLRRLLPGRDEPTVPRAVAGLPFTALGGLAPRAYGSVSAASILALVVPLAVGVALADVGAGLLMFLIGGLLGVRADPGSPRRDTSLLAQLAGVVSLVLGILSGRAFGAVGDSLLGLSWGLAPTVGGAANGLPPWGMLHVFAGVLGGAALIGVLTGGLALLAHLGSQRPARAREAGIGALHYAVIAGGAAAFAFAPSAPLHAAWWLLPGGLVLVLLIAGARGLGRLLLDLVGVVRLAAVAFLALTAFAWSTGVLAAPADLAAWILPPLALLVTLLAVLVDPAHVAMGVPYDLSLGGRGLGQPFAPLARRVVRGRRLEQGGRDG